MRVGILVFLAVYFITQNSVWQIISAQKMFIKWMKLEDEPGEHNFCQYYSGRGEMEWIWIELKENWQGICCWNYWKEILLFDFCQERKELSLLLILFSFSQRCLWDFSCNFSGWRGPSYSHPPDGGIWHQKTQVSLETTMRALKMRAGKGVEGTMGGRGCSAV